MQLYDRIADRSVSSRTENYLPDTPMRVRPQDSFGASPSSVILAR
jgi:hypothetical protein